jgi:hypothetical protein
MMPIKLSKKGYINQVFSPFYHFYTGISYSNPQVDCRVFTYEFCSGEVKKGFK